MTLNKIEVSSDMVGRDPRYEIDIMIIQALEEESELRYIDIQEKINLRCKCLAVKKPSTDTLANHLYILRKKDVIVRELDRYGCTHYSLKYNHYTSYVKEILSLHKKCGYVYSYNLQPDYEKSQNH